MTISTIGRFALVGFCILIVFSLPDSSDQEQKTCYTFSMRIVEITKDGCIVFTSLEMEELKLSPGDKFIIEQDNDVITLTPLAFLPAQD